LRQEKEIYDDPCVEFFDIKYRIIGILYEIAVQETTMSFSENLKFSTYFGQKIFQPYFVFLKIIEILDLFTQITTKKIPTRTDIECDFRISKK
jgi:hypothetical protein